MEMKFLLPILLALQLPIPAQLQESPVLLRCQSVVRTREAELLELRAQLVEGTLISAADLNKQLEPFDLKFENGKVISNGPRETEADSTK